MTNEWGDAAWADVLAEIEQQGRDAFVASVSPAGRPHLAIVWLVVVEETVYFVSDRSAAKVRNLVANPNVAAHWQVVNDDRTQLFLRGTAELVETPADRRRLWDSGAWGDLSEWYRDAEDPNLAFVRIAATRASITDSAGSGPRRRWRSSQLLTRSDH